MGLFNLFNKPESLVAIDIGSSAVKVLELDDSEDKPSLLNMAMKELPPDVFSGNVISKPEKIAEIIGELLEANEVGQKRVATAVPGPSVFTKKVKLPQTSPAELRNTVQFEAANFIPHNIDAVKLDFHVVGEAQKNQLEVLVAAAKNEVVDGYIETLALAGLETAVVDVDYFALQNAFELGYPECFDGTTALINIGARYSSIAICRRGQVLFTGDIGLGGRALSDALMQDLGISFAESEKIKKNLPVGQLSDKASAGGAAHAIVSKHIEYAASEFNRQLSFFWNACGAEGGIDRIMLCGGGALIQGLSSELAQKTGIECSSLDPLRGVQCGSGFDQALLDQTRPFMGVAIGLGLRRPGDRIVPEL